ncbi:M81 family metallopeptidase [Roseomonas sp. BN140053]|uniref:M81 family metallopeptidase n=1 Tax=Roseomonas sp. BN140053 TaxID=3391898 RepID=UPI0039EA87AE
MPRVAVVRFWYETNSFAAGPVGLDAFRAREWCEGRDALARAAGRATELGGLVQFLRYRPDWQAGVLRCASALAGGPLGDEVLHAWFADVLPGLRSGGWDGVYAALHGACTSVSDPAVELTILRELREAVGPDVPIVASFDLHANLGEDAMALLDGASACRAYLHTDLAETAHRALQMLERRLMGMPRPHGVLTKLPFLLRSLHMQSDSGPMAEVWAEARTLRRDGLLDASVLGGFPWCDSPHAGPGAMVWAERRALAEEWADHLAGLIADRRTRFTERLPGPQEALRQALAGPPGLVAVLEPSDNPGSGGGADTPGLLRALAEVQPEVPSLFAFLHDPNAVAAAQAAGVGGVVERGFGARLSPAYGPPVPLCATVERLTDGRFTNTGSFERGATVELGNTALLRAGQLRVVVTSRRAATLDPAFLELHGIAPGELRLLAVKGKGQFRNNFAALCSAMVACDTPGPATLDLRALPFRHVPESWCEDG